MATTALGHERKESKGSEKLGESEIAVEGAVWRHPKRPGRSGKQEVAGHVPACIGHVPILLARRKMTGEGNRWAGLANWAGQVGFGGCEVGFFSLSAFPILVFV